MANIEMQAIKDIDDAIKEIDIQRETLLSEKQSLKISREVLYKVNDLCPYCNGRGYTYAKSSGGDPYERSSDLQETCTRCKGTGKYIKL